MSHDEIQGALNTLAAAHGSAALGRAFRSLERAVTRKRRSEKLGVFSTAVMQTLELRDQLKAAGVTEPALSQGLEATLRQFWPKARTEPWHDQCGNCRDYGLEMHTCPGDATCGRHKPHAAHDYGVPCWCVKGQRFRDQQKPTGDDAMSVAVKQKKPARWGR